MINLPPYHGPNISPPCSHGHHAPSQPIQIDQSNLSNMSFTTTKSNRPTPTHKFPPLRTRKFFPLPHPTNTDQPITRFSSCCFVNPPPKSWVVLELHPPGKYPSLHDHASLHPGKTEPYCPSPPSIPMTLTDCGKSQFQSRYLDTLNNCFSLRDLARLK